MAFQGEKKVAGNNHHRREFRRMMMLYGYAPASSDVGVFLWEVWIMAETVILSADRGGFEGSLYNTIPAVPGCHLMFAGPLACARHGMAVAAEYQRMGRVSYCYTRMADEAIGTDLEQIMEAAKEIVRSDRPQCFALLVCCQNAIVGTDYSGLQRRLESVLEIPARIMEVNRLHMYGKRKKPMMKISQQELIYSYLSRRPRHTVPGVNLIGGKQAPAVENDLLSLLRDCHIETRFLAGCESYEDFQDMAGAWLNLSLTPSGDAAARAMEKQLQIPWLPFHGSFFLNELCAQYQTLFDYFGIHVDISAANSAAEAQIESLCERLGNRTVWIDGRFMEAPCSLARLLLEHKICVEKIFRSRFTGAEPECECWVRENAHNTVLEELQPEIRLPAQPSVPPASQNGFACGFTRLLMELRQLNAQAEETIE
jgi:hypothetical protein